MESLGKIFGSKNRVKIMRLFLFNETEVLDKDDIALRTRTKKTEVGKEITMLVKIGFIKKKQFTKKILKKTRKKVSKGVSAKPEFRSVKTQGWILNPRFDLIKPLQMLLIESKLVHEKDIITHIKKAGSLQLLLLSGLFTRDDNRELDILIVGNNLKRDILEKEIKILESEIGRELRYAFFDQAEFQYRQSMYDKLVRDILEHPHRVLIEKIPY